MFANLELEMFKRKVLYAELATFVGLSECGLRNKIKGRTEFKLSEVRKIVEFFNLPWDYLFAESASGEEQRPAG